MIFVEARLTALTSRPLDDASGWEAEFSVLDQKRNVFDVNRCRTFRIPISLEDALQLGPHVGQDVAIHIAANYEPGTVQERAEVKP